MEFRQVARTAMITERVSSYTPLKMIPFITGEQRTGYLFQRSTPSSYRVIATPGKGYIRDRNRSYVPNANRKKN